jgi:hypothetical protein
LNHAILLATQTLAPLLPLFFVNYVPRFRVAPLGANAFLLPLHIKLHGSGYLTSTRDQGCVFIKEAYQVYWSSCAKGIHTGQMVLKVVEAIGEMFF